MSLAASNLTSGHNQGASLSGGTTASISPTANGLLVLSIGGYDGTTTSQDFTVSSVSGLGLTWTRQKLGSAGATPRGDVEVWTAPAGASPGSGTITITLTATVSGGIAWVVDQFTGQDAVNPVVTGNTVSNGNVGTAASVAYGAASNSGNLFHFMSMSVLGSGNTITQTPSESPAWTSLASLQSDTTTLNGAHLATQVSPDVTHLTGSSTLSASHSWGTIGLEIAVAGGTAHSATASLTATPSLSASRTRGRFRTGALPVTPSLSASRTRGHPRTGTLTVSPAFATTRHMDRVRRGTLTVSPQVTVTTTGGEQPVTATPQGSWYQLLDILRQADEEFDYYASRPPLCCPNDGEPLLPAPVTDSGSGVELYCRFDGWQYPRDWVRPVRR